MNIPDEKQRRDAVLTDGHAFVWASAGTGKTHTLTLRALYLLLTAAFDRRAKGTPCAQLCSGANRAERLRAARAVLRTPDTADQARAAWRATPSPARRG